MKLIGGLLASTNALSCTKLADHTILKVGDGHILDYTCDVNAEDVNNGIQFEVAAEDVQGNHQKLMKMSKLGSAMNHYDIDYQSLQTLHDHLNVTYTNSDFGVNVHIEVFDTVVELDGCELEVTVEAGSQIEDTKTKAIVYDFPELDAELLTTDLDEDWADSTNGTLQIVNCTSTGGYEPQHSSVLASISASIGDAETLEDFGDGSFGLSIDYQTGPGERINGANGVCTYSLLIDGNDFTVQAESDTVINYTYDPTYVDLSVAGTDSRELDGVNWVSPNTQVTLSCISNGNPIPELTITVDGTQNTGSGSTSDGKAQYNYEGVAITKKTHASCETINGKTDSLDIDVHYIDTPIVSDNNNVNRTTPKMTKFVFEEGSPVQLKCKANSNPPASTSFKNNGVSKSFGSMFGVADTGNYTCEATNKLGDLKSVAFELIVNQAADNDTSTGGATTAIIVIIVLLIIVLIGAVGFYIWKNKNKDDENQDGSEAASTAEYQAGQPAKSTAETTEP